MRWSKEWTKRMMQICDFYEYSIAYEHGKIIITSFDKENIEEFNSPKELVKSWKFICKESNKDYAKNGMEKPFKWL